MKDGKLSNREKQTLWNAHKLLNAWIDWQEEHGKDVSYEPDDTVNSALHAAGGLSEFLSWIDD